MPTWHYVGSGYANSGPHPGEAITLTTELTPNH